MYDPLVMADKTREVVCQGNRRKYHRFRPARFYGGIATAAIPEGFQWQLKALENLLRRKVSVHPACMTSFRKLNLPYRTAHRPDRVPPEQV
jgi:uncharacterized Fe-S cluster-containing radical SAM superfamily protein